MELYGNSAVPWKIDLFEKYLDESYFSYFNVYSNETIISQIRIIDKYRDLLDWNYISANSNLPWYGQHLLEQLEHNVDWYGLARNEVLFEEDENFFQANMDKWTKNNYKNFQSLSYNTKLPWSKSFIDQYKEYWDWSTLSKNAGIPWDKDLIDYFSDDVVWGGLVPCSLMNEEGETISETDGFSLQYGLNTLETLPWSLEFLEYYEVKLYFENLFFNKGVWAKAFQPYVDDNMIDLVMRII